MEVDSTNSLKKQVIKNGIEANVADIEGTVNRQKQHPTSKKHSLLIME